MNAKEFIDHKFESLSEDVEKTSGFWIEQMNEFALKVATEAVEEEVNGWEFDEDVKQFAEVFGNMILKNIKKRLE